MCYDHDSSVHENEMIRELTVAVVLVLAYAAGVICNMGHSWGRNIKYKLFLAGPPAKIENDLISKWTLKVIRNK